ncbi:cyd operon protein YbgE [Pasteurellaceae bacterium RH1A]|nr:cyd operon protein YbgE [Pasteurellaceae bacterium RH1A]
MIQSLYNLTAKGLIKALSFILAVSFFAIILLNSTAFAHKFGGSVPYLALSAFYGMAILFIHGIGFEIKSRLWQLVFLPLTGYLIVLSSIIYILAL